MAEHASQNKVKTERTTESYKVKFMKLVNDKKPTGDPKCPEYVKRAKRLMAEKHARRQPLPGFR